ncbi:MAG: hypothetical protein P8J86_01700 [Phycisphaerales bacterium]|nr:hypothetical protein [Phycisphaerales bacterium]
MNHMKPALVIASLMTISVHAQTRLSSEPIRQVHGVGGVSGDFGASGVGERRNMPHEFEYRTNINGGRRFEHSFDLTTNAQFRAHNLDDPAASLQTTSLYNNPWYWQHVGSLQTEMMTGGSGNAVMASGADGDYYNPYFYNQWKSGEGIRHSGALTSEMGPDARGSLNQRGRRVNRRGGPAKLPGTNEPLYQPQKLSFGLNADRSVLSGDRLGTMLRGSIDDTWDGHLERDMGDGMVGPNMPIRYVGSQIRGLGTRSIQPGSLDRGMTTFDLASVRDDGYRGLGVPPMGKMWDTRFGDLSLPDNRLPSTRVDAGIQTLPNVPVAQDLTGIYQNMAERYGSLTTGSMSAADQLNRLDRDYRTLRGGLIVGFDSLPPPTTPEDLRSPTSPIGGTLNPDLQASEDTTPTGSGTSSASTVPTRPLDVAPALKFEDFGLVLRHGQQVNSLAAGDGGRFDDLVTSASQKLESGDYLRAERRFNRALRFVPGHPLATAGLGHAELGANLYLSSALTLQTLLAFQPEMIDVQYSEQLLPAPEDMDRAISILTARLRGEADLDRYGFLLAYIGHQLDRPNLITTGLQTMRAANADKSFVDLLEQVWLPSSTTDEP